MPSAHLAKPPQSRQQINQQNYLKKLDKINQDKYSNISPVMQKKNSE